LDDLIALVSIVSKQKVKQIEIISENAKLSKRTKELYEGIRSGLIKSDSDAVQILYNQFSVDSKYRKLKGRLKNKLINTLFFIDVQKFSRSDQITATIRSYHLLSAMKILIGRGKRNAAISLAKEAIVLSIKYDIVELTYLLSKELCMHYGLFEFNRKKYEFYLILSKKYLDFITFEDRASKAFIYFGQQMLKNRYSNNKMLKHYKSELKDLEKHKYKINTYSFNYNLFNALYFCYYLEKDYTKLEIVSNKAVLYFQTKKGFSQAGEFSFLQKLGLSKFIIGSFSESIEVYNKALSLNPRTGSIAWFNIRNHLFNVHLTIKEYNSSFRYLIEAINEKSFKKLYETFREPWLIKEAYMQLLIKMGKVTEAEDSENKLRPFRINRFLNEVPHYSRDKSGRNIAILIIHVLFLFIQKKDDELDRRLDALGQYSFRYLRNDETLRSNAFIKMLQKLPDAHYHPIGIQRRVSKFYKRLTETPMNISEDSAETEVIPYEHLWEIVLELLQMRLDKEI
jgi:tetratricopeptide (TPR) repeat protein